jgi:hypothetical protein
VATPKPVLGPAFSAAPPPPKGPAAAGANSPLGPILAEFTRLAVVVRRTAVETTALELVLRQVRESMLNPAARGGRPPRPVLGPAFTSPPPPAAGASPAGGGGTPATPDFAGLAQELGNVTLKAADAQAAFVALGAAVAGLSLRDVTAALRDVEAEEKRVAKERGGAVQGSLREVERTEREGAKRREEGAKRGDATIRTAAAGLDLLRAPLAAFQGTLNAIQQGVVGFVQKANPGAVMRFQLAVDDLQAVIGRAMVPTLNRLTQTVRTIANAFAGLSANGQTLIASVAAGTVGLVAFGAAALLVQTVMTGGLLPIFSAVAGALGGFAFVSGSLQPVFERLTAVFSGVADRVGAVIARFAGSDAFAGIMTALGEVVALVVDVAASVADALMPAFDAILQGIAAFAPLVKASVEIFGNVFTMIADVLGGWIVNAVQYATPYLMAFGQILLDLARKSYEGWQWLLSLVGVNLPSLGDSNRPPGTPGSSVGASVRQTSTSNVSDVLQKAREAAFKAGGGAQDPQRQTVNHLAEIERQATLIKAGIDAFLTNFPSRVATALAAALPGGQTGRNIARTLPAVTDGLQRQAEQVARDAASGIANIARDARQRLASLFP